MEAKKLVEGPSVEKNGEQKEEEKKEDADDTGHLLGTTISAGGLLSFYGFISLQAARGHDTASVRIVGNLWGSNPVTWWPAPTAILFVGCLCAWVFESESPSEITLVLRRVLKGVATLAALGLIIWAAVAIFSAVAAIPVSILLVIIIILLLARRKAS